MIREGFKVATRSEAELRYGPIDFASKFWPNQSYWMTLLEIPHEWFPHFYVMNTDMKVKHIACNVDMEGPLLKALTAVHEQKLAEGLLTFDGCFNIRMVRGSTTHFSAHSYGLAIDLNAMSNQLGNRRGGFYDMPKFVKCFTDTGFDWGGNFSGRKDPMHFSYCWEG